MFRGFGGFDDDPFFSAHREQMRGMDRMMGGFGPMGGFGFGAPFGSRFGMLEGPPDQGDRNDRGERGMVPRERNRDPFQSIFENMNSMMSQMHRSFENMQSMQNIPGGGYSYSSSKVMSYSNDGTNPPKYFEASSSTKRAPGGVKETQKTVRDSESGLHKMAVGHHIGERGHVIEKSKNTRTDEEEQKQDFYGIDQEDAASFDREFKEKTRNFSRPNEISGFSDGRRRHHGEQRRATAALESPSHHREREGREKNHAHERKVRKEKKVKMAEPESHL